MAAGAACPGTVAEEGHVRRRRREAAMAGGIKVAGWSAVGPWPRCGGPGGRGAAWLVFVLFGCVVCGSGTTRAAVPGGRREGVVLGRESLSPGAARYSAERRGLPSSSRLRGGDLRLLPESLRRSQGGRPGLPLGAACCRWVPRASG